MLDRLSADPEFGLVSMADMESALEPSRFVGRAPEQVDEFLDGVITPLLAGHTHDVGDEVRV
jgi:adenylosuccinate lyase